MSREMKKFLRQVSAKKHTLGALTVFMLMVVVAFSSMIVMLPQAGASWWNGSWDYYRTITIDNSYIEVPLTEFPLLVIINSTVGAKCNNGNSIRFLNTDNVTEYYYEIEEWNASGNSYVWVNVTNILDSSDTVILMYYGNSGASDNQHATDVWNTGYRAVWHLNGTSNITCTDATGNGYGVTGSVGTPNYQVDTALSYGVEFDGTTDALTLPSDVFVANNWTLEVWFDTVYVPHVDYRTIVSQHDQYYAYTATYTHISTNVTQTSIMIGTVTKVINSNDYMPTGTCIYMAEVKQYDGCGYTQYINGTLQTMTQCTATGDVDARTLTSYIGALEYEGVPSHFYIGNLSEIRLSSVPRNNSWLNATFHSTNQTTGFLTWGTEQGEGMVSSFILKGLEGSDKNITWSGTADSTVWSNATAGGGGTMEINMSVNSIDNVTEIRINLSHLDADEGIYSTNVSFIVSRDNTTWTGGDSSQNLTTYNGINFTINNSQWTNANGFYGTNPFLGAGLTDTNTSIYIRFKLAIPGGANTGTYSQSDWKVYLGHFV